MTGSQVDAKAIRNHFKYLIKNHFESEAVRSFFNSMEGFGIVNWYRENRGLLDSIPSGFQTPTETSFSIKVRRNEPLLHWLKAPEFTLFKLSDETYYGSGDFELTELNVDISAKLVRVAPVDNQIETINLSFTKMMIWCIPSFFVAP